MLRLPSFEHHSPADLAAATALLGELVEGGADVKLIAGGTDLLPNMKHEITTPEHVISLHRVDLRGVTQDGEMLHLGAMTPVQTVADDPLVREHLPALAEACAQIAGPQLRRMGTLGGNICLDTRCLYINQTYFWRQALGFCIKKDGTLCHVVAGGRRCVAAASNDSVLPLMLYGATVSLHSRRGERQVALRSFFTADGVKNTVIEADEILTEVQVPLPAAHTACAFEKLRARKSIDFPLLNLAALVQVGDAHAIERLDLVVSALGARPKRVTLDGAMRGAPLDADAIARAAKKARDACRPLTNLATDPGWRRAMVGVLARRALERAAAQLG